MFENSEEMTKRVMHIANQSQSISTPPNNTSISGIPPIILENAGKLGGYLPS
jgi:hypothetical protein